MNQLTPEALEYIIARVIDNAKDAVNEAKENPSDEFYAGRRLAYYEVLDIIQAELDIHDQNLKEYMLDMDLDKFIQ